ncbi:MAG: hypothetical protein EG825_17910, partial [Rhodocyclaceae bacterium]|nr:hypothetical protein [Rhodocyclaceae bacterium]
MKKIVFFNILIGIPGGALIFMSTLMFNALLGIVAKPAAWTLLLFLCIDAFIVGLLARWFRPYHGLGAAIASGVVAALMLLYLWLATPPNPGMALAVGPLGMAAVVVFSTLGG